MRNKLPILSGILALQVSCTVLAADLGINVILSGEVSPGVYGQVEIGNNPHPLLVYERPIIITSDRRYTHAQPVYLHVPPGHAKHWSKHCQQYHACGREVYFVKSREYEPDYQSKRENHQNDHDHGHNEGNGKNHPKKKH